MEYIGVFESTSTQHLFPQIYSTFPLYKMKWNSFFPNILPRLYSNIICKNIVKFFQKFEVGYIQHAHRWKVVQCDTPKVVTIVCFDPIHTIHHDIFWCDVISYSWCWICEGILMNLGFCLGSNCIRSPFCWIIKL